MGGPFVPPVEPTPPASSPPIVDGRGWPRPQAATQPPSSPVVCIWGPELGWDHREGGSTQVLGPRVSGHTGQAKPQAKPHISLAQAPRPTARAVSRAEVHSPTAQCLTWGPIQPSAAATPPLQAPLHDGQCRPPGGVCGPGHLPPGPQCLGTLALPPAAATLPPGPWAHSTGSGLSRLLGFIDHLGWGRGW